jgi:hypothetical protein
MIRGVTHLKESTNPQVTLLCLSNSNQVFINTILKVCLGCRLPAVQRKRRDLTLILSG